jgi:hypothetical protein
MKVSLGVCDPCTPEPARAAAVHVIAVHTHAYAQQGMVLGLQYNQHDWDSGSHCRWLQYVGVTVPFVAYWGIILAVDCKAMPWVLPELRCGLTFNYLL